MKPIALPVLYTFRRCPYAIRARLAISASGKEVDMREVDLRNKPPSLLACSPKGTVPVLQLTDGSVIDESLDIMRWALAIHDPDAWLGLSVAAAAETDALIRENDGSFKQYLDRYKYAGRYPEHSAEYYRAQGELFLLKLSLRLKNQDYLMGAGPTLADIAIVPFVRQFAHVDRDWFYATCNRPLIRWLDTLLQSSLFLSVMKKNAVATTAFPAH